MESYSEQSKTHRDIMKAWKVEYCGHHDRNDTTEKHIIRYMFSEPKLCIIAGMINSGFIIKSISVSEIEFAKIVEELRARDASK